MDDHLSVGRWFPRRGRVLLDQTTRPSDPRCRSDDFQNYRHRPADHHIRPVLLELGERPRLRGYRRGLHSSMNELLNYLSNLVALAVMHGTIVVGASAVALYATRLYRYRIAVILTPFFSRSSGAIRSSRKRP